MTSSKCFLWSSATSFGGFSLSGVADFSCNSNNFSLSDSDSAPLKTSSPFWDSRIANSVELELLDNGF